MAKVTIQLTGLDAVQRALKTAPDAVKVGAAEAVAKSSFAIAQRARVLVPVGKTGRLKASIASASTGLNGRVGFSTKETFYWRFVEFGTVKVGARPFMRPAAEAESETFIERFRQLGKRLERDFSTGRFT